MICTKLTSGVAPKSVKDRSRGPGTLPAASGPGQANTKPDGTWCSPASGTSSGSVRRLGVRVLAEGDHLRGWYDVHPWPVAVARSEAFIVGFPRPVSTVLAQPPSASGRSRSRPVTRCAAPSITTSVPEFQPLLPVVTATRGECCRLTCFCSPTPVQNAKCPSLQMPTSGVTCGRPSDRTVVSQKSSAWLSSASTDSHDCAVAVGSLNRLSIRPVVKPLSTSPRPRTHRSPRRRLAVNRWLGTRPTEATTAGGSSPGATQVIGPRGVAGEAITQAYSTAAAGVAQETRLRTVGRASRWLVARSTVGT